MAAKKMVKKTGAKAPKRAINRSNVVAKRVLSPISVPVKRAAVAGKEKKDKKQKVTPALSSTAPPIPNATGPVVVEPIPTAVHPAKLVELAAAPQAVDQRPILPKPQPLRRVRVVCGEGCGFSGIISRRGAEALPRCPRCKVVHVAIPTG